MVVPLGGQGTRLLRGKGCSGCFFNRRAQSVWEMLHDRPPKPQTGLIPELGSSHFQLSQQVTRGSPMSQTRPANHS